MKNFIFPILTSLVLGVAFNAGAANERFDEPRSLAGEPLTNPATSQRLDPASWLAQIDDEVYISELSIPGAKDAATSYNVSSSDLYQRQSLTLLQQLQMGVRALDLCPADVTGKGLMCTHDSYGTDLKFVDALDTVAAFLAAHPSEFVILEIASNKANNLDASLYPNINDALATTRLKDYLADFRADLTVGDLRGKALMLSRLPLDEKCANYRGGVFDTWTTDDAKWVDIKHGRLHNAGQKALTATKVLTEDIELIGTVNFDTRQDDVTQVMEFLGSHHVSKLVQQVWSLATVGGWSYNNSNYQTSIPYARLGNAWLCNYLEAPTTSQYGFEASHQTPTGIVLIDWLAENDTLPSGLTVTSGTSLCTYAGTLVKRLIQNNFQYLPWSRQEIRPVGVEGYYENIDMKNGDLAEASDDTGAAPQWWNDAGGFSGWVPGAIEQRGKAFDTYQDIANASSGNYVLAVRAMFSQGGITKDTNKYPVAYLQTIGQSANSPRVMSATYTSSDPSYLATAIPSVDSETAITDKAKDLWGANVDFNGEMLYQIVTPEYHHPGGTLRIGIKSTTPTNGDKTFIGPFRLFQNTVPTGVEIINAESSAISGKVQVYNIQGQLLRADTDAARATDGLPAGLYIVGGTKILVK